MPIATITLTVDTTQAKLDDIIDTISNEVGWIEDPENLGFNIDGDTRGGHIQKFLFGTLRNKFRKGKAKTQPVDMTDFDASVS